ncbi:MAG: ABC transporter permease [Acidimicrobiales bacterium]
MVGFLLRRLVLAAITILIVMAAVFALLQLLPGGEARAILGLQATASQVAAFSREQGFDRPILLQFATYVQHIVHGNLGYSYQLNQGVASLLSQALPKTLLLTVVSTLLAVGIAIPLGVLQALRRDRMSDHILTTLAFVFYSTPIFFLALLLIEAFSQQLRFFPPEGPQSASLLGVLSQPNALVLPIASLSLVAVAAFSRYSRSATLDSMSQDYVRTARAKGAAAPRVLLRHVVRNSLVSVVTLFGAYVPYMFSGALVVEAVYNYPGAGWLFWNAAQTRDYPVLLGSVLVISTATVIGSLLVDVLYAALDPRVRYR